MLTATSVVLPLFELLVSSSDATLVPAAAPDARANWISFCLRVATARSARFSLIFCLRAFTVPRVVGLRLLPLPDA